MILLESWPSKHFHRPYHVPLAGVCNPASYRGINPKHVLCDGTERIWLWDFNKALFHSIIARMEMDQVTLPFCHSRSENCRYRIEKREIE